MSGLSVCLSKIRKSIKHRQLTEAVFSLRLQLLKMVEPLRKTYATPPSLVAEFLFRVQLVKMMEASRTYDTPPSSCKQKKKRKKEEGKRRREEQAMRREKGEVQKGQSLCWQSLVKNKKSMPHSRVTHLSRILSQSTGGKDGGTTVVNMCHPAIL